MKDRAGKRLVAYAPSIGTERLGEAVLPEYERLMRDALSVGEESAARLLPPLTDRKIATVLDSTLLTAAEDWSGCLVPRHGCGRYNLSFMLEYSPLLIRIINELADREGLTIVHFDLKKYYGGRKTKSAYDAGPEEFLWLVQNAEHVVTNSFHGCAFSLIFHRSLWCIPHTQRWTRMTELLGSLGMEDMILTEETDMTAVGGIDYGMVDERLKVRREESLRYLRNALEVGTEGT